MSEDTTSAAWRMNMGAWILLSAVIVLGVSASVAVLVMIVMRPAHAIDGLAAPGEHELSLPAPGFYVIYLDFARTEDRRGLIRPAGYENLTFAVSEPAGRTLELEPAAEKYDYVTRYTRGVSVWGFDAAAAGAYRLVSEYPAGTEGQAVELALRQVYKNPIRDAFLGAGAVLAVTALLGAAIIVIGVKSYKPEIASSAGAKA